MKKILASIFAFAMIVTGAFGFAGCADKTLDGTYEIGTLKMIGLTATKKSISSFVDKTSTEEMEVNQYIPLVTSIIDLELKLDKNGNGKLTLKNAGTHLADSDYFTEVYQMAQDNDLLKDNGDIVIKNVAYTKNGSKIQIFPTDNEGVMIEGGFMALLGDEYIQNETIEGKFIDGVLTLSIEVAIAEADGEASTVYFQTGPTLIMKKK